MSYRKKSVVLNPTYEQEIELRIAEAYERSGYVYKRKNIKPIVFRDVNAPESQAEPEPLTLPTPEEFYKMRYAIQAWAMEGAARLQAEEDPEIAYIDAQMHVAQALDKLREKDPAAAALQIEFVRRMFKELGKEPPYPFN